MSSEENTNPVDQKLQLPPESEPVEEVVKDIPEEFTPPEQTEQTSENDGTEQAESQQETFLSPSGEVFNPEIHIAKDKLNKDGSFKRKRQRKAGQESPEMPEVLPQEGPENNACAVTCVFIFEQLGVAVCGDGFKGTPQEKLFLTNTFQRYFDEQGISDLPSGIAVVIALTSYTVAKLQNESCRQRAKPFWESVKTKVGQFFSLVKRAFGRK